MSIWSTELLVVLKIIHHLILHLKTKSLFCDISAAFNWTLAFLVTEFFSPVSKDVGTAATFWFFASVLLFVMAFTVFVIPEVRKDKNYLIYKLYLHIFNWLSYFTFFRRQKANPWTKFNSISEESQDKKMKFQFLIMLRQLLRLKSMPK